MPADVVPTAVRTEPRVCPATGAAVGLGTGIVRRLVRDGWVCLLLDVRDDVVSTATEMAADLGVECDRPLPFVIDVSDAEALDGCVARVIARFGRLDLAGANAATEGKVAELADLPVSELRSLSSLVTSTSPSATADASGTSRAQSPSAPPSWTSLTPGTTSVISASEFAPRPRTRT